MKKCYVCVLWNFQWWIVWSYWISTRIVLTPFGHKLIICLFYDLTYDILMIKCATLTFMTFKIIGSHFSVNMMKTSSKTMKNRQNLQIFRLNSHGRTYLFDYCPLKCLYHWTTFCTIIFWRTFLRHRRILVKHGESKNPWRK